MASWPGSRKHPKKSLAREALDVKGFARQQWRARIETIRCPLRTQPLYWLFFPSMMADSGRK